MTQPRYPNRQRKRSQTPSSVGSTPTRGTLTDQPTDQEVIVLNPLNFNFYLALMRRGTPAERIVQIMEADLGIQPEHPKFSVIRAAWGLRPA